MKKTLPTLLLVVFLLQLAQLPALAMEIVVSDSGSISFYNDQVLGREDRGQEDREDEKENEREREEENEREDESENEREREKQEDHEREYVRDARPSTTVPRSTNTQMRVSTDKQRINVRLEDKEDSIRMDTGKVDLRTERKATTDRLKVEASSELKDRAIERKEVRQENIEERKEVRSEAAEKAREERRERKEEKIEIQSERRADGTTEFQFESRNVKANLKNAEFVLDPETNEVTVIGPNGQEKVLSHLPDQAIERMTAKGFFDNIPGVLPEDVELELETREDGRVVYSTVVEKEEKLLGFFTRKVDTKLEMDDETGEVTETRVQNRSFLGRLLGF